MSLVYSKQTCYVAQWSNILGLPLSLFLSPEVSRIGWNLFSIISNGLITINRQVWYFTAKFECCKKYTQISLRSLVYLSMAVHVNGFMNIDGGIHIAEQTSFKIQFMYWVLIENVETLSDVALYVHCMVMFKSYSVVRWHVHITPWSPVQFFHPWPSSIWMEIV